MLAGDSATAADHLPVVMSFRDPYDVPLLIRSLTISSLFATVRWATIPGNRYRVETSSNLASWQPAATNLVALAGELSFQAPAANATRFFRVARDQW